MEPLNVLYRTERFGKVQLAGGARPSSGRTQESCSACEEKGGHLGVALEG